MKIIFENEQLLVLNKPAGLVIHSDNRTKEKSVTLWLAENYPTLKDVGGNFELANDVKVERYGIVHRTDRETSGVLVVAKDQETFDNLQRQFQDREVKKIYRAFVYGEVDRDGVIDRPIGRNNKDFRQWSAGRGARGTLREAVTNYSVLLAAKAATLVEVEPKTGRTHQIRVHFKYINHPVVADKLYASGHEPILGFKRLALHAWSIDLTDVAGKQHHFEAPYPMDFKKALKELENLAK